MTCLSNSRRSTKADDAAGCQASRLRAQSIRNPSWREVKGYHSDSGSNIGQRQELAQHTLVHPIRKLSQMTVTLVLYAFDTRRSAIQ